MARVGEEVATAIAAAAEQSVNAGVSPEEEKEAVNTGEDPTARAAAAPTAQAPVNDVSSTENVVFPVKKIGCDNVFWICPPLKKW